MTEAQMDSDIGRAVDGVVGGADDVEDKRRSNVGGSRREDGCGALQILP